MFLMLLLLNELYKIEMNCRLIVDLLCERLTCLIKRSYRYRFLIVESVFVVIIINLFVISSVSL